MPTVPLTRMSKEIKRKYPSPMIFTYGLYRGEMKIWVYRITHLKDNKPYDLTWDQLKIRCEELGVNHVPFLDEKCVDHESFLDEWMPSSYLENISVGPSVLDNTHIREGVAIRIEQKENNHIYKYKSYDFLVAEGIMKDTNYVDIEEVS